MIKVGNVLKVVIGNRFVGDVVEVIKVDEQKGIFVVLNKKERRRLLFKLEEVDNFIKLYNIKDVMEEEDDDSVFIEVKRGYEFIKNGGELVLNNDYSLISDIYTLADILNLKFVKEDDLLEVLCRRQRKSY